MEVRLKESLKPKLKTIPALKGSLEWLADGRKIICFYTNPLKTIQETTINTSEYPLKHKKGCKNMENMNKKAYVSVLFSIAVIVIIIFLGCFHHTDRPVETVAKSIDLENFPEYDLAIEYYNAYNFESAIRQFNEALEHAHKQERGAAEYWIKGTVKLSFRPKKKKIFPL